MWTCPFKSKSVWSVSPSPVQNLSDNLVCLIMFQSIALGENGLIMELALKNVEVEIKQESESKH